MVALCPLLSLLSSRGREGGIKLSLNRGWMDGLGVYKVVGVKIILSAHKANGSTLGRVGLVALPHEPPVKTHSITVKNNQGFYFSIVRIINKGVPRIIEACAWGTRLEMRNGNLCTGK